MTIDIKRVKICVTIPTENVEAVRTAICEAGAGVIGNYSFCSTAYKGIGTFKPNDNANPHIGKHGKLEFVEEERLEVICEVEKAKQVLKALREIHPYEEPAIDIYPLLEETAFN